CPYTTLSRSLLFFSTSSSRCYSCFSVLSLSALLCQISLLCLFFSLALSLSPSVSLSSLSLPLSPSLSLSLCVSQFPLILSLSLIDTSPVCPSPVRFRGQQPCLCPQNRTSTAN